MLHIQIQVWLWTLKYGGQEESEEVEDRVGEGGWESSFEWGTPPQTFWPSLWQLLSMDCLWAGTHLAILSPDGLGMPIVLVGVSTHFWIVHSPCSVPLVICPLQSLVSKVGLLLCPGKYQLIGNFLSSSLCH